MMVTRKGRRTKLIKQLQEIIYDIGEPATAGEILSKCNHLRYAPTMNQLCMMLRRHSEFSKLLKCTICGDPVPRRCSNDSQKCSECYKKMKRKERRVNGEA